jgi:hypothetical protein
MDTGDELKKMIEAMEKEGEGNVIDLNELGKEMAEDLEKLPLPELIKKLEAKIKKVEKDPAVTAINDTFSAAAFKWVQEKISGDAIGEMVRKVAYNATMSFLHHLYVKGVITINKKGDTNE